jgi:hypothetical protein
VVFLEAMGYITPMRFCFLLLILFSSCEPKKAEPDTVLPGFQSRLSIQNDSLEKVKVQVLKYANLYINDMNNKVKEDSMNYWSAVQKGLLEEIADTKFSIDSVKRQKK